MLSHANWSETNRAIESALKFGVKIHVGLTVDCQPSLYHDLVRYYPVTWSGDFAAARNALLSQIDSVAHYLLWMDSDERILSLPQIDFSLLNDLILAVKIQFRIDHTPTLRPSCHRRHEAVKWQGRIHERLVVKPEFTHTKPTLVPGVLLIHDGYEDPSVDNAKHERNLSIAKRNLESRQLEYGDWLAIARTRTHKGIGNIFDWLTVYRAATEIVAKEPRMADMRWEAAASLAYCGYIAPAYKLLAENPLNVALQVLVLTAEYSIRGSCDPARLEFTSYCLRNGCADENYGFPTELIAMDINELEAYVVAQAGMLNCSSTNTLNGDVQDMKPLLGLYQQVPDVESEQFEDDLILLAPETYKAVSLNASAAVFWEALKWPQSVSELSAIASEAFPERSIEEITREIEDLLCHLLEQGLIRDIS